MEQVEFAVDRRTEGWVYYQAKEQQMTFCGTDLMNGRRQTYAIKSDQIPHLSTGLWGYKSNHKMSWSIKSAESSK
jgi:hypothetical protein